MFYRLYPQLAVNGINDLKQKDLYVALGVELSEYNMNAYVAVRLAARNHIPVIAAEKLTSEIATKVKAAKAPVFVFDFNPDADLLKEVIALAEETGAKIYIPTSPNTRGIAKYLDLAKCAEGPASVSAKAALIFGEDPVGCKNEKAAALIKKADFTVVIDKYITETAELADVVIPMSAVAENSGSLENAYGDIQSYVKALNTGVENRIVLAEILGKLGGKEIASELPIASITFSKELTDFHADAVFAKVMKARK
jgi:anaerobic selenocysteine-containing dehydrogenase